MQRRLAVAFLAALALAPLAAAEHDLEHEVDDLVPFDAIVRHDAQADPGHAAVELWYDEDGRTEPESRLVRAEARLLRVDPFAPQSAQVVVRWFDETDREVRPVKPEHFAEVRRIDLVAEFETDGSAAPAGTGPDQTVSVVTPRPRA